MQEQVTILLVDDEARNLDALEAILDDSSYRLLRATDADTALRLLLAHDVAAIVLDIKMPGVSGFELAQLIKGTKKFRQIPIVFLTAYLVDDQDVLVGYGAGAVDYLTKPVNPLILRHKIAVFAELFRKTRALAELNEHLESRVQERTAELQASEAALQHANQQKDRFLATLAHELRNPLAPIRTGIDLLLRHEGRPETMERTLTVMNRQVTHMVRLIDDLLDVSRISRGTLELRRQRAPLMTAIDRALETVAPALKQRRQTATVEGDRTIHAVVDVTRVSQIVANLLHNASKHSPVGASVSVRIEAEGPQVRIMVVDRGAGIPVDQLERVFDMFTKIERSTELPNDGLGIGLALSRQLAELHGGSLAVSSDGEGAGATFTLTLPIDRQRSDASGDLPAPSGEAPPVLPVDGGGMRIVLVEDNEDSADLLSTWLKAVGYTVNVARTGPDGVAMIVASQPDVVLCDIGLPGMDGVEVGREVHAKLAKPPTMVALTGWGMEGDRKRTKEAGFRHHLVKPVDLDKLHALLTSIEKDLAKVGGEAK